MSSAAPIPMPGPAETARRRYARYQLSVPFDVTVFRPGAVVRLSGRAQDMGDGGLRGVLSGTTLPGERVELTISLPGVSKPLNMRAVVRHECELQCGFEFLSLRQFQREQLQRVAQDSRLRGAIINSTEWKPGLAPPPRSATTVCATCGYEFPEELAACSACGAAAAEEQETEKAAQFDASDAARIAIKIPPKTKAEEESRRPKRDAVLDSVVAVVFLITLSIGLWQWLYSPADPSGQPGPVTVELEHVFLRPKPTVAEEEKPRAHSTPAFTAARTLVSAVIGNATPAEKPEPIGVPGSAAREVNRRREAAAVSSSPSYSRSTSQTSSPAPAARTLAPAATASSANNPLSSASNAAAAASNAATDAASSAMSAAASQRPSGSDLEGMLLQKVLPMYPARARRDGVQGQVVLKAVIGKDGTIADLRPLQGPEELSAAAMDAVQHWRFRPYQLNGKPVEVETDIRLNFQLPK